MLDFIKKYSYQIVVSLILILGFVLRTNLYITSSVFEDDECRLAITMLDKNLWQMFLPLGDAQSAPPIFMLFSKILVNLFGYKERVLHFIPYVVSIFSLWFFYDVCQKYFSKKITTILATFLFVVNLPLISYAFTFKQYALDVFVGLLCIKYLPKIDIKTLDVKQLCFLTISLILLPFISLPSLFFIVSLFILNLVNNYKEKGFYKKSLLILVPLILVMGIYFYGVLLPSKINLDLAFPNYWKDGFFNFSVFGLIKIITINLLYDFAPNRLVLFAFIFFACGIVSCVYDKSETKKTSYFLLGVFIVALFASLIKVYPMTGRISLYLISIFILFILRPLDVVQKKIHLLFILLMLIIGFAKYSPMYLYNLRNDSSIVSYAPESLMKIMLEKFNPKEDMILCNSASVSSYLFYSSRNKFYTDDVREMDIRPATKEAAEKYFRNLDKNQKYWFYLIKDYNRDKVFPFVLEELEGKEILYFKKERNSMLIYLQN